MKFESFAFDHTKQLYEALRELTDTAILVGVPSDDEQPHLGSGSITPEARTDTPQGIGNAVLAYIHENGAPEMNVPARPFMTPGVAAAQEQIVQRLRDAGEAALLGKTDVVTKNFHAAGLTAQSSIRNTIAAGIAPPLAPATIAARRRRTKGSRYRRKAASASDTTPLIDTGSMLNSISYVLRKKKR